MQVFVGVVEGTGKWWLAESERTGVVGTEALGGRGEGRGGA